LPALRRFYESFIEHLTVTLQRTYPAAPILAVSAAIIRDGKVLIVRRARPPAGGLYTLPGGVVEVGETLTEAVVREVREETALAIEPVALAGYREAIAKDGDGRVRRHFVILPFAARWIAGEPVLNEELTEALWLEPAAVTSLETTDGLAEIVANAMALMA
jgi:ADP-ribose pyrophosphatase YjhB (NUDIX family)